uniref:Uncharacterized protein n=1 Tax=Oryza brachyantha TaxID=4533 RepID=J3LFH1_ORYBR
SPRKGKGNALPAPPPPPPLLPDAEPLLARPARLSSGFQPSPPEWPRPASAPPPAWPRKRPRRSFFCILLLPVRLCRIYDGNGLWCGVVRRLPVELGCCAGLSLLPLHSAVAAARLTSRLSTASRSCCALSQEMGQSVPR